MEAEQKNIIGFITHKNPDFIRGFALNRAYEGPLSVTVSYKNRELASVRADRDVKLLANQGMRSKHGFLFDLRSIGAFHPSDEFEIKAEGVFLDKTPHLQIFEWKNGKLINNPTQLFFFMHIPKTAGTSFRLMLNRQFDQDEIWPNKHDLALNNKRYPVPKVLRELDENRKQSVHLMMGHYPLWMLKFMRSRPTVITFMRRPEDQLISLAKHKQKEIGALRSLSLEDIVRDHIANDPQTRYFMKPQPKPIPITEADLEMSLRNLLRCEFVGITERFEECINYLEKRHHWNLGKINKKNIGDKAEISSDLVELAKSKTKNDRVLYEAAKIKFEQVLKEHV